jgi:hypothetical protein
MSAFIKPVEVVKGGYVRIGPVDTQFDSLLLAPHCDNAERKYVRDAIGEDFFEYLKTQRTANIINYNSDLGPVQAAFSNADLEALFLNGKLFDLIGTAVIKEALPQIHFKISSSGLQVLQANFAQPASANDMLYFGDRFKEQIGFLTREVQKFLCDNQETYEPYGFDASMFCDTCKKKNKIKKSTLPIIY